MTLLLIMKLCAAITKYKDCFAVLRNLISHTAVSDGSFFCRHWERHYCKMSLNQLKQPCLCFDISSLLESLLKFKYPKETLALVLPDPDLTPIKMSSVAAVKPLLGQQYNYIVYGEPVCFVFMFLLWISLSDLTLSRNNELWYTSTLLNYVSYETGWKLVLTATESLNVSPQ